MAMKVGGEYSSARDAPSDFEKLAGEAGLAKPLVRRRVAELADTILTTLPKLEVHKQVAEGVAARIQKRAGNGRMKFRG